MFISHKKAIICPFLKFDPARLTPSKRLYVRNYLTYTVKNFGVILPPKSGIKKHYSPMSKITPDFVFNFYSKNQSKKFLLI